MAQAPKNGKRLANLCEKWLEAKKEERLANSVRVAIEEQIVAITGAQEEGSKTHEAGEFKVTVTGKLTRSMDWDEWEVVAETIPTELHPVEWIRRIDSKGVRWLRKEKPAFYRKLAKAMTTKAAKISVVVK